MNELKPKLDALRAIVVQNCNNPHFSYREWFVKDHMKIVERIAMELCDIYKDADRDVVTALVWFHDFGKPIDEQNESQITETEGKQAMSDIGFSQEFIARVVAYWKRMELKNEIDLSAEPIEVRIVSTADGAAHFTGKFFSAYFSNDPDESFDSVEKRIRKKITQDWERKIVLPEAKEAFKERYLRAMEIVGEFPERFI